MSLLFSRSTILFGLNAIRLDFVTLPKLTHILYFCWSLSFLVNLKISKARIQPTPSQGKSALWVLYFKNQNYFLLSKAYHLQAIKEDAGHKLMPHGQGWQSACEELGWDPYMGGAFSWAWYWQLRNGECFSKGIHAQDIYSVLP